MISLVITVFVVAVVLTEVFREARDQKALRFVVLRMAAVGIAAVGRFIGFVLVIVCMMRSTVLRHGTVHFCILFLSSF